MIRTFKEIDIERLIEIINKGYIIKEESFIKEIKDQAKKIVVYDDGKIKGFAYTETFNEEKLEFVLNVYVEPKERGMGIGKALYKEAYKVLEKLNPSSLVTMFKVEEDDGVFYKKLGFKKWYGYYTMAYKGTMQAEADMEFIPYEDKYYEIFAKARQEGFYELRKENDIKPYVAFQLSEKDREKALKIKDCIYLAFDKDKLIAVAHIEGDSIERIIVTPDSRGKGYGRKTTQFAINKALSNGEKSVTLEVVESNVKAINLYKSLGFEVNKNDNLYKLMMRSMNMKKENNSKKVTNIWDKVAIKFSKVGPNYWNKFGERLVQLSKITKGAKVLDIGMGRGASLFPALKKVSESGQVIGIDFSEIMVEETAKDINSKNISNAKVLTMDARNLDFEKESFDNVIGGFSIGHLLYSEESLKGVLGILKQGGEAGFSIWGEQLDQVWLTQIVNKYIKPAPQNNNGPQKVIKFSTAEDIRNILEAEGFKNIRIHEETSSVIYKDKDEWWNEMNSNAVRGIFETIEALGETTLEEFKKEVYKGLEAFKEEDGFVFKMAVIYGFGCK